MLGEVLLQVIPVTFPPVLVEERLFIVLVDIAIEVALLEVELMVIPVSELCPVRSEMVLFDILEAPHQQAKFITLMMPLPPVQLVKVFPLIVFVLPAPPSILLKPVMALAPVTVIFEKSLSK